MSSPSSQQGVWHLWPMPGGSRFVLNQCQKLASHPDAQWCEARLDLSLAADGKSQHADSQKAQQPQSSFDERVVAFPSGRLIYKSASSPSLLCPLFVLWHGLGALLKHCFQLLFHGKKNKQKARSSVLSDRIFQIKDNKLLVSCRQYVIASISFFSSEHDGALIKGEYNKRRQWSRPLPHASW